MKIKRWMAQFFFLALQNPFLQNFFTGTIYRGSSKAVCVPSLHCYSCPSMPFSCPIGTIQFIFDYAKMLPYYALGMIIGVGAIFGSGTCAYFCPFGFLQELLYKISPFKSRQTLPHIFRHTKWLILGIFVILLPLWQHIPAFCAYICPAGTLEAGIPILLANPGYRDSAGLTFVWKMIFLISLILYVMREERAFCRYLCPLGLLLGLFNRVSLLQITLHRHSCKSCNVCGRSCPMGLNLPEEINAIDCIKCGECVKACKFSAVTRSLKIISVETKNDFFLK